MSLKKRLGRLERRQKQRRRAYSHPVVFACPQTERICWLDAERVRLVPLSEEELNDGTPRVVIGGVTAEQAVECPVWRWLCPLTARHRQPPAPSILHGHISQRAGILLGWQDSCSPPRHRVAKWVCSAAPLLRRSASCPRSS